MDELKKEHWEKCKQDNINLILQCQMQTQMAEKIIILADEKISKFKEEDIIKEIPIRVG